MDKVRIGIIGLGNIGQIHVNNLLESKVPRGVLTAVGMRFRTNCQSMRPRG
ncbi:MAG: hypothetical protein Ct9H300mP7_1990 [Verrucomicrobiota bacterium]|nr:MAG: hypothetical protein Ct9H300mP7_1990 [Verrucomicrobiota bacterium]